MFDNTVLNIVDRYQYLDTKLNEHLDFSVQSSALSRAGGRTLGAIISQFKGLKNVIIIDYGSGILEYKQYENGDKIQLRPIGYQIVEYIYKYG